MSMKKETGFLDLVGRKFCCVSLTYYAVDFYYEFIIAK